MTRQASTTSAAAPASGSWQTWRRPAKDVLFLGVVLAVMLVTASLRSGHHEFPAPVLLGFTLLAWLPLLIRHRWPVATLVAVVAAESLHLVLVPYIDPGQAVPVAMGAYQPVPLATMAAAWTLASRRSRTIGWIGGGGSAVVLLVISVVARPISLLATDLVMFQLVLIATAAGSIVTGRRERAERARQDRRDEVRRQVVAERLRIARDLHDALAHHLTVVNAQAGVARYLLTSDSAAAASALSGISEQTRKALDELRATIGLLRYDADDGAPESTADDVELLGPVPSLDHVDHLLQGFRAAGAEASMTIAGTPRPLPTNVDVTAYRIVQEALTNAAKHAAGAEARVLLTWSADELDVQVRNAPPQLQVEAASVAGSGHGLIGMRERAHACGGKVTAGPSPDGGYLVHAVLPIPSVPTAE